MNIFLRTLLTFLHSLLAFTVCFGNENQESLRQSYGNKCSTLLKLQATLAQTQQDLRVSIPPFFPISSEEMKKYLSKNCPQLDIEWAQFIKEQATERKRLLPQGCSTLKTIRAEILQAFTSNIFSSPSLEKWIEERDVSALIVRSSGAEDGELSTNAGGNESIPAVGCETRAVSEAIGKVIASYFSEKSLLQRLLNNEQLESLPQYSLFIQEMICEIIRPQYNHEKRPSIVSGVLFSSPPQLPGSNISLIQATFGGCGELAAGQANQYDTFYVTNDAMIYSCIGKKHKRSVVRRSTDGSYTWGLVPNGTQTMESFSLDEKIIISLKRVSNFLVETFGRPLDIEWVYDCNRDCLFIVQVRPLILNKQASVPTYIHPSSLPSSTESVSGETILFSDKSVRCIDADSVLFAPNIEEALERYLYVPHRSNIQAVCISERAPATSHPAIIFRSVQIPVFYSKDVDVVCSWIFASSPSLVVLDVQQSVIHRLPYPPSTSLQDLCEKKIIASGVLSSLFPLFCSIPTVCPKCDFERDFPKEYPADGPGVFDESLIDIFENQTSQHDPSLLLHKLLHRTKKLLLLLPQNGEDWSRLVSLQHFLHHLVPHASSLRSSEEGDLLLHTLHTLLFQKEDEAFVRTYSLQGIEKHVQGVTSWKKVRSLGEQALSRELEEAWGSYIDRISLLPTEDRIRFSEVLSCINNHGVLSEWLNGRFSLLVRNESLTCEEKLKEIENEIAASLPLLRSIDKNNTVLLRWCSEDKLALWGEPKNFITLYNDFQNEVVSLVNDEILWTALQAPETNSLSSSILIRYFRHMTDCFDKTCKAVKGSALYQQDTATKALCLQRVGMLVGQFFLMMQRSFQLLPTSLFLKWSETVFDEKEMLFKENMLRFLSKALSYHCRSIDADADREFLPSSGFSAQGSTIGSGCAFYRALTGKRKTTEEETIRSLTLEDLFTLIHQNTTRVLSILYQNKNTIVEPLPSHLQYVLDTLLAMKIDVYTPGNPGEMEFNGTSTPYLLSREFSYPQFSWYLVHPMRHHSALFQVEYRLDDESVSVKTTLFGHNFENRMTNICAFLLYHSLSNGWEIIHSPEYLERNSTMEFSVRWTKKSIQNQPDSFQTFCSLVMRAEKGLFFRDLTSEIEKLSTDLEPHKNGI